MKTKSNARILLFDIETMANLGWTWGRWQQDVIAFKYPWYMLTFAYKWLGEKQVHAFSLPNFRGYKKDKRNDKALCKKLWDLLDEADIIIAHNGDSFDVKMVQARFVKYGFPPPRPFKQIDTLKVAKKYFRFTSNSLNELGKFFNIGQKLTHTGFDLWLGCAERDEKKSWDTMVKYNKKDIVLLEKVYYKMRAWMSNHPNLNLFNETQEKCPNCGGTLQRRGYAVTRTAKHQRFQCTKCAAWSQKPIKRGIVR